MDADIAKVRGVALEKEGRSAEAIPLLEQALAWDSKDATVLLHLANALVSVGRAQEALDHVDRALQITPASVWGHRVRAYILAALGRHVDAVAASLEGLRLSPRSSLGHARHAAFLSATGRHHEARAAAELAISIDGRSVAAWCARGWADVKLRDMTSARSAFRRAVQIEPTKESLRGLARVSTLEESVELHRRALQLDPADGDSQANVTLLLCRLGRWDEAFEGAKRLRRAHPDHPQSLELQTRSAVSSGHVDEALALETTVRERAAALEGMPEAYRMHEALGHIELARGRWEAAEASYERADSLHPWCCLAVGAGRAAVARGDVPKGLACRARAAAYETCESRCSLMRKLTDEITAADPTLQLDPPALRLAADAASDTRAAAEQDPREAIADTYRRHLAREGLRPWHHAFLNPAGAHVSVTLILAFSRDPVAGLGDPFDESRKWSAAGRSISVKGHTVRLDVGGTLKTPPVPSRVQDALLNTLYEHHLDALESISHERDSATPFEEPPATVYRGWEARSFLGSLVGAHACIEYRVTGFFTDNANPWVELRIDGDGVASGRCFEYRRDGVRGPPALSVSYVRPGLRTFTAVARATSFPAWTGRAHESVFAPYRPTTVIWTSPPERVCMLVGRTYRITASAVDLELTPEEIRWFGDPTLPSPEPRRHLALAVSEGG